MTDIQTSLSFTFSLDTKQYSSRLYLISNADCKTTREAAVKAIDRALEELKVQRKYYEATL